MKTDFPTPTAISILLGDSSINEVLSSNYMLGKIPISTFCIFAPVKFALVNRVLLKFTPVKSAFVKSD